MSDVKTVLITGANSGLGKDCARQMALKPGVGGREGQTRTADGVTWQFAVNVAGHALLAETMLDAGKVRSVVVYAGSESARGIPAFKMPQPALETSSVDEFGSIADGSFFAEGVGEVFAYAYAKYVATLWMSSLARHHPTVRLVTMSPGGTTGTNAVAVMSPLERFFYGWFLMPAMTLLGYTHGVEAGAKRYVDAIYDARFETGRFYGTEMKARAPLIDQGRFFADLDDPRIQDNARAAILRIIA